jgi:hypothetical protein
MGFHEYFSLTIYEVMNKRALVGDQKALYLSMHRLSVGPRT